MRTTPRLLLALLPAWLAGGGCQRDTELELRRELARLREVVETQQRELEARQITIAELNQQLQQARGLTDEDLEKIFYPERIVIDRLTGGDNYDDQPGDDGVTVYVKPIDRDGDPVKVAGDIRIELYDLANPPDRNLVGRYEIPVDEVSKLWYGKLATYHYTIRCPWQHGPPAHNEITVRVIFRDYLTGRVMTSQTVCTVHPAPADSAEPGVGGPRPE